MSLNDLIIKLKYLQEIAGNLEVAVTDLHSLGDGTSNSIVDVVLGFDCNQPHLVIIFE
jgi:hypothetical protein